MDVVTSISIDVMSGDLGPEVAVEAAVSYASQFPDTRVILVGDSDKIPPSLFSSDSASKELLSLGEFQATKVMHNIYIVHADDVVTMHDKPSRVLRQKQGSSMAIALKLVKAGVASACVSAGNTGALMILSRSILRMLPGIDRPAIAKSLTSPSGTCVFLDLGANVDSSAEHLFQFAVMGAIYSESVTGKANPGVALLNVGEEEIKGNEQVKLASRLLEEASKVNYQGYVEGDQIFNGAVDVVVCDGFVGNVALKCGEGVIQLMLSILASAFRVSWFSRLVGWFARKYLSSVLDKVNPSKHNGATFLGLQGVVVKSHGNADKIAFESALAQAVSEARQGVPAKINRQLDEWLI